jgi:hypothetical protein
MAMQSTAAGAAGRRGGVERGASGGEARLKTGAGFYRKTKTFR